MPPLVHPVASAYSNCLKGPSRSGALRVLSAWIPAVWSPLNRVTVDIIGDSVYWLYANLCNPTSQIARVSGRDRTDARRVCMCADGLCCCLCRPLSTRQDLGRQGAPTPERRRRQRRLITDGRQTALHPRLPEDQSAANYARLAI